MSDVEDRKKDENETPVNKDEENLPTNEPEDSENLKDAEKEEEAKLRAKYPGIKGSGSSALLQKRLSKGAKYFDSGDYAMAKAKTGSTKQAMSPGQQLLLPGSTGDAIPTPDSVPHRKISINQKKLAGMS